MLQYEWPTTYGDTSRGWYTAGGPVPERGDVLWNSTLGTPQTAFNGYLFLSNARVVDPFTGQSIFNGTWGNSAPQKLNSTHFIAGNSVYNTGTFQRVAGPFNQTIPSNYDPKLGMFWTTVQGGGIFGMTTLLRGWSFPSDFSRNATLAWSATFSDGMRSVDYMYGKVFFGLAYGSAVCLDGKTGALIWETPVRGYINYHGAFYDGVWVGAGQDGIMYAFNTTNGDVLWTYEPKENWFHFWEDAGCISNGVLYSISTNYYTYAIDLYTGHQLWKWKSEQSSAYQTHPIAASGDANHPGAVFGITGRREGAAGAYRDPLTGVMLEPECVSLNQVTGECNWRTSYVNVTSAGSGNIMCAYGMVFLTTNYNAGQTREACVAIGSERAFPSFHYDLANTGHARTFSAPNQLELNWLFKGEGAFLASPAAANNKVYIGSTAGIFYALNHQTGKIEWAFNVRPGTQASETQVLDGVSYTVTLPALTSPILSSAAVDDGKIFFQANDGYMYCLNAETGAKIWEKYVESNKTFLMHNTVRYTGSPKVFNGNVYVGSRNGVFYCLNENTGATVWSYSSGGSIFNAPAIDAENGYVFVTIGDQSRLTISGRGANNNGTLYKFDAATGNIIWKSNVTYLNTVSGQITPMEFYGSPVLGDNGLIYVPTNAWSTVAYDAKTGQYLWNYTTPNGGGLIGSVTPAYAYNRLYIQDDFNITCIDATRNGKGKVIWSIYNGHSVLGGITFSNNKVYWATEFKVTYVADASTGQILDFFEWDSFCWSNPALYDGMLYWATLGEKVYCFKDTPYGTTYNYPTVKATLSKASITLGDTVSVTGSVTPALAGIKVDIYALDPNGNSHTVTVLTAANGEFTGDFKPPVPGAYSINAMTNVDDYRYVEASSTLALNVAAPPPSASPAPQPTEPPAPQATPPLESSATVVQTPAPSATPPPTVAPPPEAQSPSDIYIIAAATIAVIVAVAVTAVFLRKHR
ncbi:MAG: PQQ-binding-like beta-propeller repeat protein [Candidatus Bathyarchaeia archaeon]